MSIIKFIGPSELNENGYPCNRVSLSTLRARDAKAFANMREFEQYISNVLALGDNARQVWTGPYGDAIRITGGILYTLSKNGLLSQVQSNIE